MKKLAIICILLVFNFCIMYVKASDNNLSKVDIALKNNELGIVSIMLDDSFSLLFKYKDKYYLYVAEFYSSKSIKDSESVFTDYVDYIYMNNSYNYHDSRALVVDNNINDNLKFYNDKISFNDNLICINYSTDCDYVFINREDVLLNNDVDVVFYSNTLSDKYIEYIKSYWVDAYPLSKQSYTVVTIGDEYNVENLIK